jgi:uncharacterized OB-fold protein
MEADYVYTLGVAGERFFKELKKSGKIMGTKCSRCKKIYLPPRIYCEKCFTRLEEWINVGKEGRVYTFTIATIDINNSKLKKPITYAFIEFDGVTGGLIHKLDNTTDPKIGMKVKAILKPKKERKASINDIRFFKPSE